MFPGFPFQAIREAAGRGEYTVIDKETWLAIEDETRKQLTIFVIISEMYHRKLHANIQFRPKETTTKTIFYLTLLTFWSVRMLKTKQRRTTLPTG